MTNFVGDPDYTLRWPPAIFAEELERVVRRGRDDDADDDWFSEVELLLNQAFTSKVPADDFKRVWETPAPMPVYSDDDEPF